MVNKIQALRTDHLKIWHEATLYPYQELVSDKIIDALIKNLRITAKATEEEIKKLEPFELAVELSRQSGKTTGVAHTIEVVSLFFPELFKLDRRLEIGIFAPQREQAKTLFDRLKEILLKSGQMVIQTEAEQKAFREQSNANTLVLPNGSTIYVFPVTSTSKPESKTLDLMIFDEAQDLDDKIVKETIWPMGAARNAPRIYLGTAGTRICYFYRLGQTEDAIKLYFEDIHSQRRKVYEKTGDARHLIYEQTVKKEIEKHGRDSDEIARPYFGKWLIGTGQFCTAEDLDKLIDEDRKRTYHDKHSECFAGVDTAKNPDSTVVTVLRYNKEKQKKEILNWLELRGDNYKDQFDIILAFISNYQIMGLAIDSTAQGDFMPDMFEKETQWRDENNGLYRVKFSAVSKDIIYKNLKVSIKEFLTTIPNTDTRESERFRLQMLDLQQEYKGQLLSVSHPDSPDAHDDYPDSFALAEYAYARYTENKGADVHFVGVEPESNIKRGEDGKIIEHWPEDF